MIPSATYRIQFRNGMTFDRAAALAPYLKALGISHLYASPIFTATTGSTHGYDITDPNEIDPAIGGREGFDRLVKALRSAQIGLILDIVPNHMATSLENRWWRDVILTSPDRDAIVALHEAQSWRLMSWREAPRQLSWRRFFEITGLIGVRVEEQAVLDLASATGWLLTLISEKERGE